MPETGPRQTAGTRNGGAHSQELLNSKPKVSIALLLGVLLGVVAASSIN